MAERMHHRGRLREDRGNGPLYPIAVFPQKRIEQPVLPQQKHEEPVSGYNLDRQRLTRKRGVAPVQVAQDDLVPGVPSSPDAVPPDNSSI